MPLFFLSTEFDPDLTASSSAGNLRSVRSVTFRQFIRLEYSVREPKSSLSIMELRKRAKLSQEKVAQALGIRQATISSWETKGTDPHLTPWQMKTLLGLYNCDLDQLIAGLPKNRKQEG